MPATRRKAPRAPRTLVVNLFGGPGTGTSTSAAAKDIDATPVIWEFFARHPKPQEAPRVRFVDGSGIAGYHGRP